MASSAYDLALLFRVAMRDQLFAQTIGTDTVPFGRTVAFSPPAPSVTRKALRVPSVWRSTTQSPKPLAGPASSTTPSVAGGTTTWVPAARRSPRSVPSPPTGS